MDYLRGNSVSEEQLARIKAPAGLDLGRIKHEEMAVAVIAEIVQRKALAGNEPGSTGPVHAGKEEPAPARADPVAAPAGNQELPGPVPDRAPSQTEDAPQAAAASDSSELEEAIDPVCDMTVTVKGARYHTEYNGKTYYFCCPACRKLFQNNPQDYLKVKTDA